MRGTSQQLGDLHEIREMMERSSRFISLSGLSGVAAGMCALAGTAVAVNVLGGNVLLPAHPPVAGEGLQAALIDNPTGFKLLVTAFFTFAAALVSAVVFTCMRSASTGVAIWGKTARRLAIHVFVPMVAGGLFMLTLVQAGAYQVLLPGSLVFYGLALINAGKFTFGEISYLGYLQLLLGLVATWLPAYGLVLWAIGFGLLHIVYGVLMWNRYERQGHAVNKPGSVAL